MKILTGSQIKYIDKKAIEDLKIPGLTLMENAGRAVSNKVEEIFNRIKSEEKTVLVICGRGNNGGDGFVAARHLAENNIPVNVLSIYREQDLSGAALINHNLLDNFLDIVYFDETGIDKLKDIISGSAILVDAIFGTGLKSEIKGDLYDIINTINTYCEGDVISVDIPSGIDADTGKILGNAVVADYTVTFFAPKLGTVIYPGAELSGEIEVCDIGIPAFLADEPEYNINLVTSANAASLLPLRPKNSHKGTFGSVFNIAGSFGMAGAAFMSAYSSLKSGAGYSILAVPETLMPIISAMAPEVICVPLKETSNKAISKESLADALDRSAKCNVFLIGPGIGTDLSTIEFVFGFTQELIDRGLPAIFDADALNCLASRENFTLPLNSIITPHPKELSRLMKMPVEEILKDKIKAARDAAAKFNAVVVLKGAKTVIAEPNGTVYINPTGNSALATAGTGDVLAGMIAGFIAQGLALKDAAILGVYLHGLAGDLASDELTEYSVTATDLFKYIPKAIKQILPD